MCAVAALLLSLPACGLAITGDENRGSQADGGERHVQLKVFEGPKGSTLALVPVFIGGEGPFAFALDTGASRSLVDEDIVQRIGLTTKGKTRAISGVTGRAKGKKVPVDQWRVGDVGLDARTIVGLDLPDPEQGPGLQGLLGSDVLSEFAVITIDYAGEELILRPNAA